jgi:tetratricopeptide (TPR) repeat protein
MELGKYDDAEPPALVAMKHNPIHPEPYYLLGDIFCKQQRFDEAVSMLRKADELLPEHPLILHLLGWAIFMGGDPDGGRVYMLKSLNIDDGDIRLFCDLAVLEMHVQNYQKAKEYSITAKRIAPDDPMVCEVDCMVDKMTEMYRQTMQKINPTLGQFPDALRCHLRPASPKLPLRQVEDEVSQRGEPDRACLRRQGSSSGFPPACLAGGWAREWQIPRGSASGVSFSDCQFQR